MTHLLILQSHLILSHRLWGPPMIPLNTHYPNELLWDLIWVHSWTLISTMATLSMTNQPDFWSAPYPSTELSISPSLMNDMLSVSHRVSLKIRASYITQTDHWRVLFYLSSILYFCFARDSSPSTFAHIPDQLSNLGTCCVCACVNLWVLIYTNTCM